MVRGFEDVWRPVAAPRRTPKAVLSPVEAGAEGRARLSRVIRRTPEVMVKITGRTRDTGHLRAHLDYISRNGRLEMEDPDGMVLAGRRDIEELAEDWSALTQSDRRRRANTPFSLSVVLSMPHGADPVVVRDAARAFAADLFMDRFDYVFVLHTDTPRPHVHLAVRTLGEGGARLNPKKADLEAWRQVFAQALRDRGVEAEATPRRARGVTRKSQRTAVAHIERRHALGLGPAARVRQAAYREAAQAAFFADRTLRPWEAKLAQRQARVRRLYLAQAALLRSAISPSDRALGKAVEAFVRNMPRPDTRRLALARALREANARLGRDRETPDRVR